MLTILDWPTLPASLLTFRHFSVFGVLKNMLSISSFYNPLALDLVLDHLIYIMSSFKFFVSNIRSFSSSSFVSAQVSQVYMKIGQGSPAFDRDQPVDQFKTVGQSLLGLILPISADRVRYLTSNADCFNLILTPRRGHKNSLLL